MRRTIPGTKQAGFTLIELLVVVAILGILASIAVVTYQGYVSSSQKAVAETNLQTLKLAEEAYYYDYNTYKEGKYDPKGGTNTLETAKLGWTPDQDGNKFIYEVTKGACGDIAKCYSVKITGFDNAVVITE